MPSNTGGYVEKIPKQRGRCTSCLCMSWKVFTCIFSHFLLITSVVSYCCMGSYLFQWLEADYEKDMKSQVKFIRGNFSLQLWDYTQGELYLLEVNWTKHASEILLDFENSILEKMKREGWDGVENPERLQWTRMGALFYSIIVITTIGYGHISPKTDAGKISTIFYAIVGIPLMLLCLSNIGDIMASSFRFIYWRICCFVCTREPKRRPRRSEFQRSISHNASARFSNRASMRRSVRVSQRTQDSGIDSYYDPRMSHAYSDTDLRYGGDDLVTKRPSHNRSQRFSRYKERDRLRRERHTVERERMVDRPSRSRHNTQSLDRRSQARGQSQRSARAHSMSRYENNHHQSKFVPDVNVREYTMTLPASRGRHRSRINEKRAQSVEPRALGDVPILCNKYAIDDFIRRESLTEEREQRQHRDNYRSRSMPRSQINRKNLYSPSREASPEPIPKRLQASERKRYLAPPLPPDVLDEEECIELEVPTRRHKKREKRERKELPPSPRIMSPMGFAIHRQARLMETFDEEAGYEDDYVDHVAGDTPVRPVPIWLCVFLVIGYIIAGAFYFTQTEEWTFLDSAYFCFITLTTIGFGDFVPARSIQDLNQTKLTELTELTVSTHNNSLFLTEQEIKIAGCSLYLLFGISLLAMSFNLVQEEVIANVKSFGRALGILKEEDSDY
ncbi:uncharacterized protein LOC116343030 isoform X2 [Contarinia nasturtii]|uniref:uncharacterized protein LOC116343030 isoform X2 n=1 Tax=Contarinia nasturtii TaxID=265458 RepID=UPI0012D3D8FE|nr:uncharacterized protein LOC116343030 isoform X2 [Contarinia nasturtii]